MLTFAAGAFSGLLAFGISFMSGLEGRLGWSWIFVSSTLSIPRLLTHSIPIDHRGRSNRLRGHSGIFQYVTPEEHSITVFLTIVPSSHGR